MNYHSQLAFGIGRVITWPLFYFSSSCLPLPKCLRQNGKMQGLASAPCDHLLGRNWHWEKGNCKEISQKNILHEHSLLSKLSNASMWMMNEYTIVLIFITNIRWLYNLNHFSHNETIWQLQLFVMHFMPTGDLQLIYVQSCASKKCIHSFNVPPN